MEQPGNLSTLETRVKDCLAAAALLKPYDLDPLLALVSSLMPTRRSLNPLARYVHAAASSGIHRGDKDVVNDGDPQYEQSAAQHQLLTLLTVAGLNLRLLKNRLLQIDQADRAELLSVIERIERAQRTMAELLHTAIARDHSIPE